MRSILLRFFIALFLGLAIGLVYGWLIQPVEYIDTAPSSLRADYKTDYVLMVAEAYIKETDQDLARKRLATLGPKPPVEIVREALTYAMEQDLSEADIQLLNRLGVDLESGASPPEIGGP